MLRRQGATNVSFGAKMLERLRKTRDELAHRRGNYQLRVVQGRFGLDWAARTGLAFTLETPSPIRAA